jgi:hypothetical protein
VNVCSSLLWKLGEVPKRGARARASAVRCCGVWCTPRSRRGKGAGVRAPRRLPLRVCLPASEIWRTEDKADRLKQGACARALLSYASVGNGTHRTAGGASLGSACARPALVLAPLGGEVFMNFLKSVIGICACGGTTGGPCPRLRGVMPHNYSLTHYCYQLSPRPPSLSPSCPALAPTQKPADTEQELHIHARTQRDRQTETHTHTHTHTHTQSHTSESGANSKDAELIRSTARGTRVSWRFSPHKQQQDQAAGSF